MVRWWWFGPCATKPELEREMHAMREAGIGGFEVTSVYPLMLDDPDHSIHNYSFLSDEHLETLRFVSAKAGELGLRMDLTLGSGWPYGGPGVPVTEAAGKLRFEVVAVKLNEGRIPMPDISAGEKLIAGFLAPGNEKSFQADSAQQILPAQREDGTLRGFSSSELERPHVVLFFIASRTGQQVKRAAVGAEGFVLDHYDRRAIQHYLATTGERLMQAFGVGPAGPPRAVFCDSLEVYGSDWTPDFMEEFRKRRGYDLAPHLPALVSDIGGETAAIRHDWGETLSELFNERFVSALEEWAQQRGTQFRAQLYGTPPALLSSYATVDLPEGEGADWKNFTPVRWASSASHLFGRPVTSSETWTWLHSPAFRATPLDLKAEADVHFLEGSNQLVGHGWPYSPPEAGEPGWRFYAAAALNSHNPWWMVMPDIALYLQRVSFILRQGDPVNEVAIYLPTDDAWARSSLGQVSVSEAMPSLLGPHLIPRLLECGYNFDFIDDGVMNGLAKAANGGLEVNRNRFRVVILPGVERMPLTSLEMLADFARQGGILVATRRIPSVAPGFANRDPDTRRIRELAREIFQASIGHFIEDEEKQIAILLPQLHPPDVDFSPRLPEIGFVHRRTAFADIYFLANTGNQRSSTLATFRVRADRAQPEWWDPFTGKSLAAEVHSRTQETATVRLNLEPYESRILVFSNRRMAGPPAAADRRQASRVLDLSDGWTVTFDDPNTSYKMDHLRSWTDDVATRYFSGGAKYEKTFTVPSELIQPGREIILDFGEGTRVTESTAHRPGMRAWLESPVREAAAVYINGRRAGSVWHPPYSLEVTGLLRAGENTIQVHVGNLAINRMAGAALPDYRLLNARYGERFKPQDMNKLEPLPSGILGPVRLIVRLHMALLSARRGPQHLSGLPTVQPTNHQP